MLFVFCFVFFCFKTFFFFLNNDFGPYLGSFRVVFCFFGISFLSKSKVVDMTLGTIYFMRCLFEMF